MELSEPLTDKEVKEFRPKMQQVFVTIFEYADTAITYTNRKQKEAKIWSTIDNDDIDILVDVILSGAKDSRILATGVRKITKSYNLMRIGLITFPRFFQTYQHYAKNGGFMFPSFGGMKQIEQEVEDA